MNYKEYINSKAQDYKQYLIDDLKTNMRFSNIVDSIFFPLSRNIKEWLEESEVKSFNEYRFKGAHFINRFCTRDEIDKISFSSNDFSRYTVFSYLKCNSREEAMDKTPTYYHFVRNDFYKIIDNIIFDRLKEYKREASTVGSYKKKISDDIDIVLSTHREHIELKGITGYTLPSLIIKIKGQGSINFDTMDVRNLLFIPVSSFLFFYTDSHNYTVDKQSGAIRDLIRKNDEPVIYSLKDEQKFLITNSWENIDRYNKYIQIILELSFHYFRLFEKWLTQLLNEKYLK